MAPYEHGRLPKRSIELSDMRSVKRRVSTYNKGKSRALPRKIKFQKKLVVIRYMGENHPNNSL